MDLRGRSLLNNMDLQGEEPPQHGPKVGGASSTWPYRGRSLLNMALQGEEEPPPQSMLRRAVTWDPDEELKTPRHTPLPTALCCLPLSAACPRLTLEPLGSGRDSHSEPSVLQIVFTHISQLTTAAPV
ncbi:unnamed protein product [Arctogadus glacialis]